jgi:hypothetical protein
MSFLENYVNSTLVAQQKLSQPITLAAYQSYYDALAPDGKKLTKAFGIHPGQNTSIYFEPISSSKLVCFIIHNLKGPRARHHLCHYN